MGCKKNKECTVPGCEVRRKHLTAIHNAVKESERKRREQLSKENTNNDVQNQESSARSQFVGMAKHEESALDKNGLSIVPVKVKSRGERKTISTYALLDCGSTASFCSDHLLKRLGIDGKRFQMQLSTIDGVNMKYETTINHLQVMDMHERVCIDMAKVFSTKNLNVSKTAIATDEDLMKLPNMRDIELPGVLHGEEVNLLIGVDAPEALQPLEIRKSENGGPFAVKSIFGWALNGPLRRVSIAAFSNSPKMMNSMNSFAISLIRISMN